MANPIQYSRRFTDNGTPIKAVSLADRIDVGIKTTVTPELPFGFRTDVTNLQALSNYVINQLQINGITDLIVLKEGGGLVGSGTASDPLRIDSEWIDSRYYSNENYAFSQVGGATDFALPISGSYFSVTYPYVTDIPHSPSMFLESNGELRILKHVTNGELIIPTYSFWSNYKNTNVNTVRHTDIPYNPPGLLEGEWIGRVFQATNTAMVGEIWTSSGFQEWVFIELNGTFDCQAHKLIRLGTNLTNLFNGVYSLTLTRNVLYYVTINAVIQNGKRYVACVNTVNNPVDGNTMSLSVAEIGIDGSVSRLENWTTTNPEGNVISDTPTAVMYQTHHTTDPANLSAMILRQEGVTVSPISGYSAAFGNRMAFGPVDKNGDIIVVCYSYTSISSGLSSACKPVFYMKLNIVNRTLTPAINGSQRPVLTFNAGGATGILYPFTDNVRRRGHWGQGWELNSVLPDGTRAIAYYTASSLNTPPEILFFQPNGLTDPMDCGRGDVYYITAQTPARRIEPKTTPPTPVRTNGQAIIVYDKLIQIDSVEYNGRVDSSIYKSINRLIGTPTDKIYTLIEGTDYNAPKALIPGFELNSDRVVRTGLQASFNAFEVGGVYAYHNALWSNGANTEQFARYFDTDINPSDEKWLIAPSAVTDIDSWLNALPSPNPTYPDNLDYVWYVIPPFPGVGVNRAFIKAVKSWKVDDPGNVHGMTSGGAYYYFGLVACTYSEDGDGNLTLTSVDMSGMPAEHQYRSAGNVRLLTDAGIKTSFRSNSAFKYTDDKILVQMRGGGTATTMAGNSGLDLYGRQCVTFDRNTFEVIDHNYETSRRSMTPTLNPLLGYGVMTSTDIGLGAFYYFRPVDLETNMIVMDKSTWRICSSSRPPAGFSFTVSSPIDVYTSGAKSLLPIGTYDLFDYVDDPTEKTLYMNLNMVGLGVAELEISETPVFDDINIIHLGKITTTTTEISEIQTRPITRWENYRPSVIPIGSAIPVSTGNPGEEGHVEYASEWNPDVPITEVILTGDFRTTENFNGEVITVSEHINLYNSFVQIMGRAPNVNEAIIFINPVNHCFVGTHMSDDVNLITVPAIDVSTLWPEGVSIRIINDGFIIGIGGYGATFTDEYPTHLSDSPTVGDGGDAIYNDGGTVTVSIVNRGYISGGGGGGGWGRNSPTAPYTAAGGGGGAPYGPKGSKGMIDPPFGIESQNGFFTVGGGGSLAGNGYEGGQGGNWNRSGKYGGNIEGTGEDGPGYLGLTGYSLNGRFKLDENSGPVLGLLNIYNV